MLNNIVSIFSAGAAAVKAYESIATVTVGSGGAASVTFSSIGTDWTHLQVRYFSADERASFYDSPLLMRFNSDTASNYAFHELVGDGSNANSYANANVNVIWNFGGGNLGFGVGTIDILDYKNTNKNKTTRNLSGTDANGVGGNVHFVSGLWRNTNAISSITFTPFSGNFRQYSHFALYGIKAA